MGKLHDVARAIMLARDDGGCIVKDWAAEARDNPHVAQALRQARVAVEAMREPDDVVIDAMAGWSGDDFDGTGEPDRQAWRAAIDAILAEDTNGNRR